MLLPFRFRPLGLILLTLLTALPARGQTFEKFAVVSQEGHASEAGCEPLRHDGNAIDAAIATAFALAVTHPAAGNLGGGGFIVAYLSDEKRVVTIDFRETAPSGSTARMYLDEEGQLVPRHRAGPRAAGVPGTVRGLGLAHQKYGSRPWAELIRPAIRLAREGFPISETLARSLNAQLFTDADKTDVPEDLGPQADRLADFPASVAAYRKPDGQPWQVGDRLIQPDLADTLERIAEHGADEFYTGKTAELIVRSMEQGGGLIRADDLAGYRAVERPPTHITYKEDFDVYGMGPPSSGGIVDALMLNILERYDLRADGRDSPRTLHRVTEAMRRAYFIRATRLADPDVVDVPIERLTSKEFADELARSIDDNRATPSTDLADFPIVGASEGPDTTHLSTYDAQGSAVALTYTLEQGYGSKAVVPGAGFLLNNEMGDFNLIPGRTDTAGRIGTKPNRIAPGKRMLSSQSPTLVLRKGEVVLVTGSPGGRTIPNTVLWVLLNTLEFRMEPRAAVDAPRTHHAWFPDALTLEGGDWPQASLDALLQMGHSLRSVKIQGDAHTIAVDPPSGRILGLPDPRRKTSRACGE